MSTAVVTDPQLQSEALTTVERAHMIVVVDNNTREMAAELGRGIAGLIGRATEWFSPMKRLAAQAHKEICTKENEVINPLEAAKRHLSSQIGTYDQAQERARRAEEVRQQEQARLAAEEYARIAAEEQALDDAIALEAKGDTKGAEAVLAHPVPQAVYVPPVVIPRSIPKAVGVSSGVTWGYRITNESLIPREFWVLDEKKLAQVARAMKDKLNIPGVEPVSTGKASFRA